MKLDFTDEQLEDLDREVGGMICRFGGVAADRGPSESEDRIERILRRVRLEDRIQGESDEVSGGPDGSIV